MCFWARHEDWLPGVKRWVKDLEHFLDIAFLKREFLQQEIFYFDQICLLKDWKSVSYLDFSLNKQAGGLECLLNWIFASTPVLVNSNSPWKVGKIRECPLSWLPTFGQCPRCPSDVLTLWNIMSTFCAENQSGATRRAPGLVHCRQHRLSLPLFLESKDYWA